MNINFLSQDLQDPSATKVTDDLIPMVSAYLLEFYLVRKQMDDQTLDADTKKTVMAKFKLIVDIIGIYKDPNILKTIKDYHEEKEREKLHMIEIEENIQRERNYTRSDCMTFGDFLNNRRTMLANGFELANEGAMDQDAMNQDAMDQDAIEHDAQEHNKFMEVLNKAHDDIYKNSTLRKNIGIERSYRACFDDDDDDETQNEESEPPQTQNNQDSPSV